METTSNTASLQGLLGVSREKYWKELTADEKIERLRYEVRRLQNECDDLRGKLYKTNIIAEQHTHDEFGRILVPASNLKESSYIRKKIMDKEGDEVFI